MIIVQKNLGGQPLNNGIVQPLEGTLIFRLSPNTQF